MSHERFVMPLNIAAIPYNVQQGMITSRQPYHLAIPIIPACCRLFQNQLVS